MATATVKMSEPVVPEVIGVTLELSKREAEVVKAILGRVSGDYDGPRGDSERVYMALAEAGVKVDGSVAFDFKYDTISIRHK